MNEGWHQGFKRTFNWRQIVLEVTQCCKQLNFSFTVKRTSSKKFSLTLLMKYNQYLKSVTEWTRNKRTMAIKIHVYTIHFVSQLFLGYSSLGRRPARGTESFFALVFSNKRPYKCVTCQIYSVFLSISFHVHITLWILC